MSSERNRRATNARKKKSDLIKDESFSITETSHHQYIKLTIFDIWSIFGVYNEIVYRYEKF